MRKKEKEGIDSGQVKVNDTTCCNVRVKDTRRRRRRREGGRRSKMTRKRESIFEDKKR